MPDSKRIECVDITKGLAIIVVVISHLVMVSSISDVITVKNSNYAIVPVTSLIEELAKDIGFSSRKARSIRLAVEEMLTERIQDSYAGVGNIRIKVSLMSDWLRVSFSDTGTEYCIDKRLDTSLSAKIILAAVDNFHTDRLSGKPIYCMDFLYQSEVKITDFLMRESS